MNVKLKNLPKLRLGDLLRRRKMTLKQFLDESGVHSYGGLVERCHSIGVLPPDEAENHVAQPVMVSSPQDGVVVLEPPAVIDEITGHEIDPDAPVLVPGVEVVTDDPQKRRKKKREGQASEQ